MSADLKLSNRAVNSGLLDENVTRSMHTLKAMRCAEGIEDQPSCSQVIQQPKNQSIDSSSYYLPTGKRGQKNIYVMEYFHEGKQDIIRSKVGISKNVRQREASAEGLGYKTKKKFRTVAVFYVDSDILARKVETEVCKCFTPFKGKEYFDVSPWQIIDYVRARIKEIGFTTADYWIDKDYALPQDNCAPRPKVKPEDLILKVEVPLQFRRDSESGKAKAFYTGRKQASGSEGWVWLPNSQIKVADYQDFSVVTLPEWLARKYNLLW